MIEPAAWDDWNDSYEKAPLAAFFQSPAWSGIWERYTQGRYQPSPLLATVPSGQQVLIPATRQRLPLGLGHTWHMAPAGTYGGWLPAPGGDSNASSLSTDDARFLLQELGRYCGSMTYRWYPLFAGTAVPDLSGQRLEMQSDRSHLIDGSGGEKALHEVIFQSDGKMRYEVNKARRSGIRIRKADSQADWAEYHQIYLDGIRRWKTPPQHIYGLRFFELLADMPEYCELWLAERDKATVAGAILFFGNDHVVYWHGAFLYEYRSHRPVNLMLVTAIKSVCKRGYRWFDFNPSRGLSGVEQFKRSFGAIPYDSPLFQHTSTVEKMLGTAVKWARKTGLRRREQK